MKSVRTFFIVLVTAPDQRTARRLAQTALEARLAACVNLVPAVESHYWWKGKLEAGMEILLLIKTTRAKLARLERLVLKHHPYNTPEFLTVSVTSGNGRYLDWLAASVAPKAARSAKK
jgi:periplasmic divalent cation tolerance protein